MSVPSPGSGRPLLLALDQGTSSTRAMALALDGRVTASAQCDVTATYPADGWVEQDPGDIWRSATQVLRQTIAEATRAGDTIAALGITNQRETTILWDRRTGKPIYNAIVWQDRRTADLCKRLKEAGEEVRVRAATGLLLDPYFSATKIAWILDHVAGAREAAAAGHIAFGTVDTWLIWQLTAGAVHATDATNASRTNLLNLATGAWDAHMLDLFDIPASILPDLRDSAGDFGTTAEGLFDRQIPIRGVAGDQQAAAIGQACFTKGTAKSTYGTGCFVLVQAGDTPPTSQNALLSSISYQINGQRAYCLEGAIFTAGSGVQWLRDRLGLIDHAAKSEAAAESLSGNGGVYLVPAFTGLGAPHWAPEARGMICGLTPQSGSAHIIRAMIESCAYQTRDLLDAIARDGVDVEAMAIDGGMVRNNWFCQFLADICDVPLTRPMNPETTAIGAAALAGLGAGLFTSIDDVAQLIAADRTFTADMDHTWRAALLTGWQEALRRALA